MVSFLPPLFLPPSPLHICSWFFGLLPYFVLWPWPPCCLAFLFVPSLFIFCALRLVRCCLFGSVVVLTFCFAFVGVYGIYQRSVPLHTDHCTAFELPVPLQCTPCTTYVPDTLRYTCRRDIAPTVATHARAYIWFLCPHTYHHFCAATLLYAAYSRLGFFLPCFTAIYLVQLPLYMGVMRLCF